jgi:hypothetical protein
MSVACRAQKRATKPSDAKAAELASHLSIGVAVSRVPDSRAERGGGILEEPVCL